MNNSSSPAKSAETTYTGNSLDFDLFALHSNVYKTVKASIKNKIAQIDQAGQIDQAQNKQAENIIKEYIDFLKAFIEQPTGNTGNNVQITTSDLIKTNTVNLPFKNGYTQEEPFFKLIHSIIKKNQSINNANVAKQLIDQSKIIMAAVDSLLLSVIVNKNNIQTSDNTTTFSSVNPQSIEDLVMNSFLTTNTGSESNSDITSNPDIIEQISSIISSINDCVITNKYPTSDSQSPETNVPSLDTFDIIIKNNTQIPVSSVTTSTPVKPLTPDIVLSLLNEIVTKSVMKTPKLKTQFIEKNKQIINQMIITNGYFLVGGNIQCTNDLTPAFQIDNLTKMNFLNIKPNFLSKNLLTNELPPTITTLVELNKTICNTDSTNPKQIYIVGYLYCVNGVLIPPDLNDIIGIYNGPPDNDNDNDITNNNINFTEIDLKYIRIQLNINAFCGTIDDEAQDKAAAENKTARVQAENAQLKHDANEYKREAIQQAELQRKQNDDANIKRNKRVELENKKAAELAAVNAGIANHVTRMNPQEKTNPIGSISRTGHNDPNFNRKDKGRRHLNGVSNGGNYTKKIKNKQSNKYTRRNYYDNTELSNELIVESSDEDE